MEDKIADLVEEMQNESFAFIENDLKGSSAPYHDKMNFFFIKKIAELQERIENLELTNFYKDLG